MMTADEETQQPQQQQQKQQQEQLERDSLVSTAKLDEQTERYDEMAANMKTLCRMRVDLTAEERNLMSIAFKNWVGLRRSSLRTLIDVEKKETGMASPWLVDHIKSYRQKVENEFVQLCNEVISIINDFLIPSTESPEIKAFYHKMKGDYSRYLAEFLTGEKRAPAIEMSKQAYDAAAQITTNLPPTNSTRLGLALNYSVFYYEIMNDYDNACKVAKQAFDDAVAELDILADDTHKESTMILQLLRDNLAMWTAHPPEVPAEDDD